MHAAFRGFVRFILLVIKKLLLIMGPSKKRKQESSKTTDISNGIEQTKKKSRSHSKSDSNKDEVTSDLGKNNLHACSNIEGKGKNKEIFTINIPKSNFKNSTLFKINNVAYGGMNIYDYAEFRKRIIKNDFIYYHIQKTLCPFERRVTSMTWHPIYPDIFVCGSKGGELNWHRMDDTEDFFRPGIGAGGSIVGLKFDLDNPCCVYTASISGLLRKEDFRDVNSKTYLTMPSPHDWFTCVDVCYKRKIILSSDNTGNAYLLETSGEKVWNEKRKLHKSKILHCEFNMHNENIFVTSSVDRSLKLWDIRTIGDSSEKLLPLREISHDSTFSAAYFSPSNGLNLLTTDQSMEIQVYSGPGWSSCLTIKHPHRHFQHITAIKANWHPIEDIIIVGRYPDNVFLKLDLRTIDFYDASTGKALHRIASPSDKIVSLCAMNSLADTLACSAGYNIAFMKNWKIAERYRTNNFSDTDSTEEDNTSPPKAPKRPQKKKNVTTNMKLKTADPS